MRTLFSFMMGISQTCYSNKPYYYELWLNIFHISFDLYCLCWMHHRFPTHLAILRILFEFDFHFFSRTNYKHLYSKIQLLNLQKFKFFYIYNLFYRWHQIHSVIGFECLKFWLHLYRLVVLENSNYLRIIFHNNTCALQLCAT